MVCENQGIIIVEVELEGINIIPMDTIKKEVIGWGSLLSACQIWRNTNKLTYAVA